MDVRNCKGCGKLFNYIQGPPMCPTCAKALDAKFEEVKEYVYEHPRVDIQEVSEVFEISVAQIKQWIREERLSFADDSMIGLDCESCGVTIKTGRFCKSCKDKLARGFQDLYYKPEPPPKPTDPREKSRMRFLDQDRNI
ncbi:MAG: flagellar protein [Anaerolineaceae bacterium]|nr:MAG: flagellar protein [Anaerolineaceae bacterium]